MGHSALRYPRHDVSVVWVERGWNGYWTADCTCGWNGVSNADKTSPILNRAREHQDTALLGIKLKDYLRVPLPWR